MPYTVVYKGYLFEGDNPFGWNRIECEWPEAISIFNFYGAYPDLEMEIIHEDSDAHFNGKEWY